MIFSVFVDGNFAGIAEDEIECWEVAEQSVQGSSNILLDDSVDRVSYHKINTRRFHPVGKAVFDTIGDEGILCYDNEEAEMCADMLNKVQLEKEKVEAKLRAMAL